MFWSTVCCRLIRIVPCISFAMMAGPWTCRFGSAHSYSNDTKFRCNGTELGHSCEFLSKLGASFLATGGQGSARQLRVLWLGKLEFRCKAHRDLVWKMFGESSWNAEKLGSCGCCCFTLVRCFLIPWGGTISRLLTAGTARCSLEQLVSIDWMGDMTIITACYVDFQSMFCFCWPRLIDSVSPCWDTALFA